MTRQEIQALIDAKIKGQGTAVDAGSVLPAILTGILDLIEQGGGGGTADAVQYIPQELTEPQQMQARKNQGLYYEETSEGEQTYIRGDNYAGGKISDNTPAQSDIISLDSTPASELYFTTIEHGYTIATSANPQRGQEVVTVYTEDFEGASKGIYFPEVIIFAGIWVDELHWYGTNTTVHQIPSKYIPQTVPAVKIEIPSNERVSYGIGYVLLNNYVTDRDVVFSIEGKTINQVAVRNMLDTTSTGDVWSFGTGNTYNFYTNGYYLVEIEVTVTSGYEYYYATVFVETANQ